MRLFDNLRLAVKLPILMGLLALLAMMSIGYVGYRAAKEALIEAGEARMKSAIDSKLVEFELWLDGVQSDLGSTGSSPQTVRALRDFTAAWTELGTQARAYVREQFIDRNPFPAGERYKLARITNVSDYSVAHARFHESFVSLLLSKGYHDALLVDVTGRVVYTAAKEDDLGDELMSGPLQNTQIGRAVRRVLQSPDTPVYFSDFERYDASGHQSAAFAATGVTDTDGTILGALVLQISPAQIEKVLRRHHGADRRPTSYLVGPDQKLRTSLKEGSAELGLGDPIERQILKGAFSQGHLLAREAGSDGRPALITTGQINVPGLALVLAMELPEAELVAPVSAVARKILVGAFMATSALAVIVWLLARSLSVPMVRLSSAVGAVARGEYAAMIKGAERQDEIGEIARALARFRDDLSGGAEAARQSAFRGAAVEASSAPLLLMDREFRVTYANSALVQMFGARRAEFARLLPDFDPGRLVGTGIEHSLPDGRSLRDQLHAGVQLPLRTEIAIGQARLAVEVNEVRQDGGVPIGFVAEWRDITVEQRNQAILGSIEQNMVTLELDGQGTILALNERMAALLDASRPSLTARSVETVLFREAGGAEVSAPALRNALLSGASVHGRYRVGAPGSETILEGGFAPVHDRDGQTVRIIFIGSDVTAAARALGTAEAERARMQAAQDAVVAALRVGLGSLSEGDLTVRLDEAFDAEYERLRADFNLTAGRLAEAVGAVTVSVGTIEGEAGEIGRISGALSRQAEEQAATIEQTAAALDELTASVQSAAASAGEANSMAAAARTAAEASGCVVREAVGAMGEIERSSERITRIVGVIDEIAFQTNLLALNAGVEAARAGEAGRGFGVVANEVRALSQRCAEAAREIGALIADAAEQVKHGVGLVGQTGRALDEILGAVNRVAERMGEIATSSGEQSAGLAEINLAVNQIDAATQENTALFSEATAAAQRLAAGARVLANAMERFRIGRQEPMRAQSQVEDVNPRDDERLVNGDPAYSDWRVSGRPLRIASAWDEF